MKKQILRAATSLSLFALFCACAHAQSVNPTLRAHVPFEFRIDGKTLPAGDYTVTFVNRETNLQTLLVKSADGHSACFMRAAAVEGRAVSEDGRLVFNRYGGEYFLSQVWTPADRTGLALRKSRGELNPALAGVKVENATVKLGGGK